MNTIDDNQSFGKQTRVNAGKASLWHIHKDHIKYASVQATRVDFSGRNQEKVLAKIAEKNDIYAPYKKTAEQQETYQECQDWIETHL